MKQKLNEERMKELKEKMKTVLSLATNDPLTELDLVDKIQRLGVAYHFEAEIEAALQRIYDNDINYFINQDIVDDDCAYLHIVALRFRLLIQAGYYVSPDVFNKFKDEKDEFKSNLRSDTKCMLSFYEASHLGFNGEDIMDEATTFTTNYLKSILQRIQYSPLATEVESALKIPLQKSIDRVQARHYISIYQADESRNESLLEFAKLDFNMVQQVHRKEISEILRWWKAIDFKSKLPYEIRDRVVEAYCQIMACYFEPQFTSGRILLTKLYLMTSTLDDTFDVYGNLEELAPLVDAFQRWDVRDVKDLAEHMKIIFLQLANILDEAQEVMTTPAQQIGISYLKQEMKTYTKGLLEEAKVLLFQGEVPTLEDWLPIAEVTIAINTWIIGAVLDMGDSGMKEILDWIVSKPKIIKYSAILCRLFDDIASFEFEHKRGITLSSVSICMKHEGLSESEAIEKIQKRIISLWKDMGQECLRPNPVPMRVLQIVLNLQRIMEMYYGVKDDGYSVSTANIGKGIDAKSAPNFPACKFSCKS
ncbi:hypothetical protein AQUCO_02800026v1 [Aquilegia coerulea]|uniref:Uncharacterized protein n=1 Tax=Aquilegia coerulea TaxID=218851 RepID=A0A2G5D3L1_AQUCA|nr:hypothetical protein AQUCO_02800026v1 [Aquilegia coerulea]